MDKAKAQAPAQAPAPAPELFYAVLVDGTVIAAHSKKELADRVKEAIAA